METNFLDLPLYHTEASPCKKRTSLLPYDMT